MILAHPIFNLTPFLSSERRNSAVMFWRRRKRRRFKDIDLINPPHPPPHSKRSGKIPLLANMVLFIPISGGTPEMISSPIPRLTQIMPVSRDLSWQIKKPP